MRGRWRCKGGGDEREGGRDEKEGGGYEREVDVKGRWILVWCLYSSID